MTFRSHSDVSFRCQEPTVRSVASAKRLIELSNGRTMEWRKQMALNLIPYLFKIAERREHSDAKVCKMVAYSCFLILARSPVSLKDGLAPLLDALVALSVHENLEVREESLSYIRLLTDIYLDHNGYDFIQPAEENFYLLLTRLPRLVQEEGLYLKWLLLTYLDQMNLLKFHLNSTVKIYRECTRCFFYNASLWLPAVITSVNEKCFK